MTGIIIALVSIPISMGYAQVAGLPAAYGLYGSVFPILIFGLMSGSREFIFGVDAAPAALVGAFLAGNGIEAGSERAVQVVPMITLFAAVWLLIMRLLHAGKLAGYISTPVMGGFISGISTTIILMQLPKLMGGSSGSGELIELSAHIVKTAKESFNGTSLLLGGASLAVLLVSKRFIPGCPCRFLLWQAAQCWDIPALPRSVPLLCWERSAGDCRSGACPISTLIYLRTCFP